MSRMDLVMTTFNRKEFTFKALHHIAARTKTPIRIIVVDNNSTDGTQEMLFEMKRVGLIHHLIFLERNYGIHKAKNYGLALVRDSKYYIDTDNDLLCAETDPDCVQRLIALMDKNPEYGAIACRPQVLVGRSNDEFLNAKEVVKFSHIGAHLRIMRTDVVKKVGGWEMTYEAKRNHEDSFIAGKLEEEGLLVGYARDVRCWHQFGGDDNWGYKDMPLEDHGHREIWPPTTTYENMINSFNTKTWEEVE